MQRVQVTRPGASWFSSRREEETRYLRFNDLRANNSDVLAQKTKIRYGNVGNEEKSKELMSNAKTQIFARRRDRGLFSRHLLPSPSLSQPCAQPPSLSRVAWSSFSSTLPPPFLEPHAGRTAALSTPKLLSPFSLLFCSRLALLRTEPLLLLRLFPNFKQSLAFLISIILV